MLPAWLLPPALHHHVRRLVAASVLTILGDGVLLAFWAAGLVIVRPALRDLESFPGAERAAR